MQGKDSADLPICPHRSRLCARAARAPVQSSRCRRRVWSERSTRVPLRKQCSSSGPPAHVESQTPAGFIPQTSGQGSSVDARLARSFDPILYDLLTPTSTCMRWLTLSPRPVGGDQIRSARWANPKSDRTSAPELAAYAKRPDASGLAHAIYHRRPAAPVSPQTPLLI